VRLVIKAWNTCGGMDWSAIPTVAEIYGFRDVEVLIAQFVALRDFLKAKE